jgi:hypothetical protein
MKPISNYIYTVQKQIVHYLQNKSSKRTGLFPLLLECSQQVQSIVSALSEATVEGRTSSSTAVRDKSVDS